MRVKQCRQNRTFTNNQKALYKELDGKMKQEQVILNAEDRLNFGVSCGTVDHDRCGMDNDSWERIRAPN